MNICQTSEWRTYHDLVEDIGRLVESGTSGSLLITTAEHFFATVIFNEGNISVLSYRIKLGMDALQLFQDIGRCKYRFLSTAGIDQLGNYPLPETRKIMEMLKADDI